MFPHSPFHMVFLKKRYLRAFGLLKVAACSLSLLATVLLCLGLAGRLHGSIASENALTGNLPSEWDVNGIGDPSIQGFATDFSVNRGTTVQFKINTTASAYHIDIYRLGYYGGRGARKVATINPSASLPQIQPAFVSDPATGLVDCGNWAVSASWAVPASATSGVYIARPARTDNSGASHIIFIVRDDAGASDFLFQTADTTWQAYNNYGGINLYRYLNVPPYRAYKVSYNRPFNNRGGTQYAERESFLFNAEYPMIRWMEANGYNVSYASGMDTDRRGSGALLTHKVFLSVGHDEYWSGQQRTNIEAARAGGVHLGFFSGNELYWKTRWENSIAGPSTANRTLVCYKETRSNAKIDPSPAWTGTWRDPRFSPPSDGGRPENAVTGQFFTVDAFRNDPMMISSAEGKMRFWRNTGIDTLATGQTAQLPAGVLGFEWNEVRDNGFLPSGLFRLSTTTFAVDAYLQDYGSTFAPGVATHSMTLYRHASGALVFGAGTIQWSWGLDATHDFAGTPVDVRMKQATVNLFADMGVQPATLQAGLVAATASTDMIAPTSVIQMVSGGTLQTGAPVNILGTAADTGGGNPAGVEFSYDGGATWHLATGAANWSGTWTPFDHGPITFRSRAVDDSGRIENPGPGISATVSGGVNNGSFESGATGWTTTGNLVIGSPYSVATHGTKLVAFNSGDLTPNGVLSQTFATVAGQTYTLAFDAGVIANNTNSQNLLVTVVGTSSLLSQSIVINGLGGLATRWVPQSFTFVADSASATLTFRDQSATSGSLDLLLDKVRVTSATLPQVATPTFSPVGGTYLAAQSVALSDTTPGAAIYYTTNGSTPTAQSTFYTTPITVATTTTIKAIAVLSGWSNSVVASATYTIQLPAAPSSLTATTISVSQIDLAWVDNATNETGFKIERKTGAGGTYAQIATAGVNSTTYTDTGLTAGATYFYQVRATNGSGNSSYSPEASAIPAAVPAAPSGLTATAVSVSQINLTWVDNATNETGFKIERKTGAGGTYAQIATAGANATTYLSTGLTAGTDYFYRVRATSAAGDSAYSPEAGATTVAVAASLTNGSFESNFTGWTLTGNAFIESTPYYTATDGVKLVSFNGDSTSDVAPTGVLSQTFTTSPGTTYTLAFDMGATGSAAVQQILRVTVDGAGNLLTQDVTKTSNGTFTSQWSANSYTFVANSATATLTFRDLSTTTIGVDALLDNVRVTANTNTPPTITDVADKSTNEDAVTSAIAFTIGDFETAAADLTVSSASSNPSLVPLANVILGGSGANRTVTITPAANQSGSSTITLTVSDGSLTASETFVLTVTPVNDPPTIADVADESTDEDAVTSAIAFTIGDLETATADLTVSSASSNPSLVPLANVILGGSGANRTVTITPAANQSGSSTITLTVSDGSLTASDTFVLTVTPVNDPPLAIAQPVSLAEDGTVEITLTGSDLDGNSLTFLTGNATHGTVSLAGAVATYTPSANFHGPDSFTFTANDGIVDSAPAVISITVSEVLSDDFIDWLAERSLVAAAEMDSDSDSVRNAVEYLIGGDPVTGSDVNLLPTTSSFVALPGGNPENLDYVRFTYRRTDRANNNPSASIKVEWGTHLVGPWADAGITANVVVIVTDDGFDAGVDRVDVYLPRSLAVDGRFFIRLGVTITPP